MLYNVDLLKGILLYGFLILNGSEKTKKNIKTKNNVTAKQKGKSNI